MNHPFNNYINLGNQYNQGIGSEQTKKRSYTLNVWKRISMDLIDMHVHTSDSPDADIPAWRLVQRGIENGLGGIGFVAHLDLNPEDFCYGGFNAEEYDESIASARRESDGRISVMKGLEIGEPHLYEKQAKELVDYSHYDFITGALHSVEGIGMILGKEVFADGDPMEIVENYYSETLRMVEVSDIDILAHMGLFRRGLALAGLRYDFNEMQLWPEIIDSILRVLIERNTALELNTSGLRRIERMTYPIPAILERFRELGGTLVTLGSDTHREPHVFFGLKQGAELLLQTGFREAYSFVDREPRASGLA